MRVPMPAPTLEELLGRVTLGAKLPEMLRVGPAPGGRYLHWDELRHRTPPPGLSLEEWWLGVKMARLNAWKPIPLQDREGRPFGYVLPDPVLRHLHAVDQDAAGGIALAEEVTSPTMRDRYIVSSLIEESITSSQLEGASTTAEVARALLRSGRPPTDRSERMIVNNFLAMRYVREHRGAPMTPERIRALHARVTEGTLEEPSRAGGLRTDADDIVVSDAMGRVLHRPPAAAELPARLAAMCDFANGASDGGAFVHPVVRAILLHFWLAYDHPFVDGNGRTARALFYWSLLANGYWLAEYLSISRLLKRAPSRYVRSFLHTETDANDLTYFLVDQLDVVVRAIDDLKTYLRRKMHEVRDVRALLRRSADFNHRQLALLGHALRHPGWQYTVESHRTSHAVTRQTARTDLVELAARGLLHQSRRGKAFVFTAPDDLARRLAPGRAAR